MKKQGNRQRGAAGAAQAEAEAKALAEQEQKPEAEQDQKPEQEQERHRAAETTLKTGMISQHFKKGFVVPLKACDDVATIAD